MLIITLLVVLPVAMVTAYFAFELFVGLLPGRTGFLSKLASATTVIVVPAHDEETVIERTIQGIREQAAPGVAILVVADNCVDRTAELARSAGAEVIVRNEPDRRGKGFALAAARDRLSQSPPEVVVIIDADCRIDGDSIVVLISAAARRLRPCQAINLLAPDLRAPALVQISSFAFMIKNLVRQKGLQRLAGRAHLTGTGMALPWEIFDGVNLGDSNIVEDLAMGLELASGAAMPMLVPDATVWSPAASASGTLVQRERWEGGYLAIATKTAPAALLQSLRRADLKGFCAALDLCVPPVALLALLNCAALVLATVCLLAGGPAWPLFVQLAVGFGAALTVAAAWFLEGRQFASGRTLLGFPFYVLWKLPMYVGLLRRGAPKEWLRGGR